MIRSPAGFDGADRIKRYLDYYQPSYGVMMLSAGQVAAFSPASLFASGEQGVWYDPSDMTTLFQDAAGTTPVTAVEQPVGRILDKSGRGNHATQSTSASRPVLSARVNLLTRTEEFDDAAWTKTALNISPNTLATTDPLGGNTADIAIPNTVNTFHILDQRNITIAATGYTVSVYAKAAGYNFVIVQLASDNTFTSFFEGCFNISNGTIESTGRSVGYTGSRSISFVGNGWYRCTITVNTATANSTGRIQILPSSTNSTTTSYAGNGTSGVYFWGADLRVSNAGVNLPVYQRVVTATDYDTTGFPMYLKFDGTDDSMATGTINPGSVDKTQVFAGMRNLLVSTAVNYGCVVEYSANLQTNNGVFSLFAPDGLGGIGYDYTWSSKGTSASSARVQTPNYVAPRTTVTSGLGDVSGDSSILRLNGAQVSQSTTDQGTGNYLSYPLYIGRRGGTTLPFNGHLYSLIVRFSATNLPAATIAQTETWVNGKTYAY